MNSIYYIIRIIIGLLLPSVKVTSIVMMYIIIIGSTYVLFRLHLDELVGPWLITHDDGDDDADNANRHIPYTYKEQTSIAIQFSSIMIVMIGYLLKDYVFAVPHCITINNLYSEIETKLFWINNSYLSLTIGFLCTLAMIPVWRYWLGRLFKNDDQYCEKFEAFVSKYFTTFVIISMVTTSIYLMGVALHRRWYRYKLMLLR